MTTSHSRKSTGESRNDSKIGITFAARSALEATSAAEVQINTNIIAFDADLALENNSMNTVHRVADYLLSRQPSIAKYRRHFDPPEPKLTAFVAAAGMSLFNAVIDSLLIGSRDIRDTLDGIQCTRQHLKIATWL